MKGMLDFLEKAGLVTRDSTEPVIDLSISAVAAPPAAVESPVVAPPAPTVAMAQAGAALNLDEIYSQAGITPALYPAERLLRLVDGLAAMDPATRLMAIQAMDAADESWTIADPLRDASSKLEALAAHGEQLKSDLQQIELQTQGRLDAVTERQAQVVGEIRKQIAELEALVERELTRAAQETATHQASLQEAREQTASLLAGMAQASARLQSLSLQFAPTQPAKE
jgi:hypothetical protein